MLRGLRERERGWYRRCMGTRLLAALAENARAGKIAGWNGGPRTIEKSVSFFFFFFARDDTVPGQTLTFFV